MGVTRVKQIIRVSSMEAVNILLSDGWIMLEIEDGVYTTGFAIVTNTRRRVGEAAHKA